MPPHTGPTQPPFSGTSTVGATHPSAVETAHPSISDDAGQPSRREHHEHRPQTRHRAVSRAAEEVYAPVCEYAWLGTVEYRQAWALQRHIADERARGARPDTLLLMEHPPVFTTGRRNAAANLRLPEHLLGAPLVETDRGGDITFHGPGQLIAYPIVDLKAAGLGIVDYVRALEAVIISTLAGYGIQSQSVRGLTGVWAGDDKIAAIGVRVSRPGSAAGGWITTHGLALNVSVDLDWFARIVACGIADRGVTSMKKLLGTAAPLPEVSERLAHHFGEVFGHTLAVSPDRVALRG